MIKNKLITLFLAIVFCLNLTACNNTAKHEHSSPWCYPGEDRQKNIFAMNQKSIMYVDRQGTDDIYSSILILENDDGYDVEISLYRVGCFSGTAVETQGGSIIQTVMG